MSVHYGELGFAQRGMFLFPGKLPMWCGSKTARAPHRKNQTPMTSSQQTSSSKENAPEVAYDGSSPVCARGFYSEQKWLVAQLRGRSAVTPHQHKTLYLATHLDHRAHQDGLQAACTATRGRRPQHSTPPVLCRVHSVEAARAAAAATGLMLWLHRPAVIISGGICHRVHYPVNKEAVRRRQHIL